MNKNLYVKIFLVCALAALAASSIYFLKPEIKGDGDTYLEAMQALSSGEISKGFLPNRILTTFLGLQAANLFSKAAGSLDGWLIMNILFFFASCIIFYNLIFYVLRSQRTAILGTLFLASNYAMLRFGLNFLMDMGGWMFYIVSVYFAFDYLKNKNYKSILLASAAAGAGGLFKEYAFLGVLPVAFILIYENRRNFLSLIKKSAIPALIVLVPTAALHLYVYFKFGYTYLDWLGANREHYVYPSRITEYVKSFGSLLNILGLLFVAGLRAVYKEWGDMEKELKLFLFSFLLSVLPVFVWPAITQRVLFVAVPFIVLVSSFFIKRYERFWPLFALILAAYILASLTMDSLLLPGINLPI